MRGIARSLVLASAPLLFTACDVDGPQSTPPADLRFASASPNAQTSSKLKLDQSNLVTDHLGTSNGRWFQTFVPKTDNLARVDLLLIVNQVGALGETSTCYLFTDITQPPVDSASVTVTPPIPGEIERTVSYRFGVSNPLTPLSKGTTYAIGIDASSTLSWEFAYGDPYPAGQAIGADLLPVNPSADFVFTTYALKK